MLNYLHRSTKFIFQGPDYDAEEESELSVTELKQQRDKQKREAELLRQNELQEAERQQEAAQKMLEDQGCSWGLGESYCAKNYDNNNVSHDILSHPKSLTLFSLILSLPFFSCSTDFYLPPSDICCFKVFNHWIIYLSKDVSGQIGQLLMQVDLKIVNQEHLLKSDIAASCLAGSLIHIYIIWSLDTALYSAYLICGVNEHQTGVRQCFLCPKHVCVANHCKSCSNRSVL